MRLLDVKNLCVEFPSSARTVRAVSGVDFEIRAGEIVGLVGESGCGKTMTSLSVMGLLPPRARVSGEVRYEDRDLLRLPPEKMRDIRGDRISMIFQEPMSALNPVLTVERQICEPLILHRGASREEARAQALDLLQLVQVPQARERLRAYPHQLSGGLCQRVMIAMALICQPALLIADEPTTALDVTIQAQILSLLVDLRERLGTTILMITHDLGVVAELCERVYVMYAGRVVESADVYTLFDAPLHPYTAGLMRSIPTMDDRAGGDALYSIPGMVPSLDDLPEGCAFAPRCPEARQACTAAVPPLLEIAAGRTVRCWKYGEGGGYDA